ncbi:MAG: hypothetical protein AB2L07_20830 [Thermoanaerobaculaceae bacterium]
MRRWNRVALAALGVGSLLLGASWVAATDTLASGQLQVQGNRLTLYQEGDENDAQQTLNVGEVGRVRTCYGGVMAACGSIEAGDQRVAGLEVLAELHGPELPEPVTFQTVPGGTFVLPGFQQEGDYWLSNIRLVRADTREVVGLAEPAAAVLNVRQILLASAVVTRLSLADLEARGITLTQSSFQAYNFAVGFVIDGSTVTIELPVLFEGTGSVGVLERPTVNLEQVPEDKLALVMRWQPPSITPFRLELGGGGEGLFREEDEEGGPPTFPLFGAVVVPGTISFLNQFFDAQLIVANGAPPSSGAALANVTGTLRLPAGNVLRLAETVPAVLAGQAVPVLGESGERTLAAGARGTASWTVEGLAAGTHALRIDIAADLERPGRETVPLAGSAQAAVEVVDARFHLTFSHPDVVREDEDYSLFVTVTNLSRAPQNLVSVELRDEYMTGAHRAGTVADPTQCTVEPFRCTIPTLQPGQSETLEFRLVADATGEVVATTYQASSVNAQGSILLRTGVGLLGIPLSPASLVLPRYSDRLKTPYLPTDAFYRANMRFLGLAYSLAVAPAGASPSGLPRVIKSDVERRAIDFADAGQRTWLGEDTLRSLEVLALDLVGNRKPLEEIDALRRAIGEKLGPASQASTFAEIVCALQEDKNLDAQALFDHFVETTSYAAPFVVAVLSPSSTAARPELEVRRATPSGLQVMARTSDHAAVTRDLPFGEMLAVQGYPGGPASAALAIIGHVSTASATAPYQVLLRNPSDSQQEGRLKLLVPEGDTGGFRQVSYGPVVVPPHTVFVVDVGPAVPNNGGFALLLPGGSPAANVPAPVVSAVSLPPFALIGSRQDFAGASTRDRYTYGMAVTYLFNRPPASSLVTTPEVFRVRSSFSGQDVQGQPVSGVSDKVGKAVFIQDDERVVMVRYSSPVSALLDGGAPLLSHEHLLEQSSILDRWSQPLAGPIPPVTIEVSPVHTGGLVDGRVVRGTGASCAGATVQLLRSRRVASAVEVGSVLEVVAEQVTGADGYFYFDFVEEPPQHGMIDSGYALRASVPEGADPLLEPAQVAEVSSLVRLYNRLAHVNIALLGRGHLTGHLTYLGGGPVVGGKVTATSMLFRETRTVGVGADGSFSLGGVPVGPITLTGEDPDRYRVFATVGIESPGQTVNVELEIQRRENEPPTFGKVAGTVLLRRADGSTTAVSGADVEVYSQGGSVGRTTTDEAGLFYFSKVPTGRVTVQAAHWLLSRTPALTDLDLAEGQIAQVTLTLAQTPVRSVAGRVFFSDPVGGGLVPVQGAVAFIEGPGCHGYSGADGTFRLDGVPGQATGQPAYRLKVIDTQRRLQGEVQLPFILPESPEVITAPDIVLESMKGGVDGVVLDPLGRPLGGAKVVLFPYAEKSAGPDGRFSFDGIGVGTHAVVAHVDDGLTPGRVGYFGQAEARVVFGGHRAGVTVRLRGSGIVNILTRTSTSPGVMSVLHHQPTYYSSREYKIKARPEFIEGSTDQNGSVQLVVPVGDYSIIAYNAFHGQIQIGGQIEYNGHVRSHEIVFQELSTVQGVVVDVDGVTPVPGAEVHMATATLLPQRQFTDGLGRFHYELVPPGNVVLTARATVGTVERVAQVITGSAQPGQTFDVKVRLQAQGMVTGQVVEWQGGSWVPVGGARFYVSEHSYPQRRIPAGWGTWSFTDAEGRFGVPRLNVGGVSVTACHPVRVNECGWTSGTLAADWEVREVPRIELRNDVGSIVVTVRDPATGAVVPDCQLTLGLDRTVTDESGRGQFDVLPLGYHSVYAFHAPTGRSGLVRDLHLETPGQTLAATLYLEARGEVNGHLYDDAAKTLPVAGASVLLSGSVLGGNLEALATTSGRADSLGYFEFGGIPARALQPRRLEPHVPTQGARERRPHSHGAARDGRPCARAGRRPEREGVREAADRGHRDRPSGPRSQRHGLAGVLLRLVRVRVHSGRSGDSGAQPPLSVPGSARRPRAQHSRRGARRGAAFRWSVIQQPGGGAGDRSQPDQDLPVAEGRGSSHCSRCGRQHRVRCPRCCDRPGQSVGNDRGH